MVLVVVVVVVLVVVVIIIINSGGSNGKEGSVSLTTHVTHFYGYMTSGPLIERKHAAATWAILFD